MHYCMYMYIYIYILTGYLGPQPTTGPPGKYLIFPKIVIKPPREYADRKLSMKQVKKKSIANTVEMGGRKEGLQKGVSQKFNESAVLEVQQLFPYYHDCYLNYFYSFCLRC
jgi:hypothetical protein